ncbi:MAG: homoserine dehydrogenase [Candidatus Levybacteria bacterium]|nr:homoserine dehydrogenase [Candidatus Levybacteria bacterium]
MAKIVRVGLLGLGTVGSGVFEHFQKGAGRPFGIELKTVAVANPKKERDVKVPKLTKDVNKILDDPEIDIVIELIGGIDPAKEYIEKALRNRKNVVTANKAVLARYAKGLFALARKQNVDLAFEASVGGGIPIIQLFRTLRGEKITKVMGILNGTTNYILTKMEEGLTFGKALNDAQKRGFAEKNHILDTGGFDARDKLAILTMLIYNTYVDPQNILCEGITKITTVDLDFANRYGEFEGGISYTVKLLAIAQKENGILHLRVHPALIRKTHPLANVTDEFNAIYFEGELAGAQLHTGRGAGKNATTSAVFSDILRVANNIRRGTPGFLPTLDAKVSFGNADTLIRPGYLRMDLLNEPGSGAEMFGIFAKHKLNVRNSIERHKYSYQYRRKEFVPDITNIDAASEKVIKEAIFDLKKSKRVRGKPMFIRFED